MNFRDNQCASAQNAMQDGRLRQAQLKMLAMLKVVDELCTKHNLSYWLEGGTLLGAIRHQGFIPWDDDLDISMPRESFDTFLALAPKELPDGMWLQTAKTDPGYFNLSAPLKIRDRNSLFIELHETGDEPYQQGIFIDVFVYDKLALNKRQRQRDKFIAKKLLRLLQHKYAAAPSGHYANLYRALAYALPKDLLESKLQAMINRNQRLDTPYLGYGYDCVNRNLVKAEDIFPLKRVNFEGAPFNIPNRFEVILEQLYGDYLQLPPKEARIMKHCQMLIPELGVEK